MKRVRPFVREDIPQVADLHRRVFQVGENPSHRPIPLDLSKSYADYFEDIFFQNPWYDEAFPSLVNEESSGRITGFLGIMPRRMSFNRRIITISLSSQFIVDPDSRSELAGVSLLQTHLKGPSDLTLTDEANNISRKLWQALGGDTALLFSIQWTRLLRPGRYAVSLAEKAGLARRMSWAMRPVGALVDVIAARKLPRRFALAKPQVSAEELRLETFLTCLSEFSNTRALWPEYDDHSLTWLLEMLNRKERPGALRKLVVRNSRQEIIGWYLYYLNPGGVSAVVQIVAKDGSFGIVLDHLFHDAWQEGAIAISGQLEPRFMQEFSERHCLFDCGKPWVLIHSRDRSLIEAISYGNALLSKLEGELCMRFQS